MSQGVCPDCGVVTPLDKGRLVFHFLAEKACVGVHKSPVVKKESPAYLAKPLIEFYRAMGLLQDVMENP